MIAGIRRDYHAFTRHPASDSGRYAGSLPGDLKPHFAPFAHSLAMLCSLRSARYAHYVRDIPGTREEPLGFAVTCRALWRSLASAARVMNAVLKPDLDQISGICRNQFVKNII